MKKSYLIPFQCITLKMRSGSNRGKFFNLSDLKALNRIFNFLSQNLWFFLKIPQVGIKEYEDFRLDFKNSAFSETRLQMAIDRQMKFDKLSNHIFFEIFRLILIMHILNIFYNKILRATGPHRWSMFFIRTPTIFLALQISA